MSAGVRPEFQAKIRMTAEFLAGKAKNYNQIHLKCQSLRYDFDSGEPIVTICLFLFSDPKNAGAKALSGL